MFRLRFLFIIFLLILSGCANRYGYEITQTTISVASTPSELKYYIVSPKENKKFNPLNKIQIPRPDNYEYIAFLRKQKNIQRAVNVPLVQPAGSRIVVVSCGTQLKLYPTFLKKNYQTKLAITCNT